MSDVVEVQVVQPEHNLVDDVSSLALSEDVQLGQSLEKLAALHELRDNIIIVVVLDQVDDADDVGVTLLAENGQLILQELNINSLLLYHLLGHYLDRELQIGGLVPAHEHLAERALTQLLVREGVPLVHVLRLHVFELLEVVHVERLLLRDLGRVQRLLLELNSQALDELVVAIVLLLDNLGRRDGLRLVILIISLADVWCLLKWRLKLLGRLRLLLGGKLCSQLLLPCCLWTAELVL